MDGPVPKELRLGYKDCWKAVDVLEYASLPYEGQLYDENNERIRIRTQIPPGFPDGSPAPVLDDQKQEKTVFMMMSLIEPHHQNCMHRYVAPDGYADRYRDAWVPGDLSCRRDRRLGGKPSGLLRNY